MLLQVLVYYYYYFLFLCIQIKYLMHSWGWDGRTQMLRISASTAETLKPRPRSPLNHEHTRRGQEACIGTKETQDEWFKDLDIYSVRTVCIYIYLAHIFAFQLYLIFKVYQCRNVRPAVCNIIVQIDFFLYNPVCWHEVCDEGQNVYGSPHKSISKAPMMLSGEVLSDLSMWR